MTHPLTPREKVEPSLDDLLRKAVETMKSWTPEQREAHFEAQKKAWVAAEMAFGDEGTRVVTALASGSGDHAELARLVDDPAMDFGGFGRSRALALLAEIAALRRQHEADTAEVALAGQNLQSQRLALTEAERKLAEAVGLLRDLLPETPRNPIDGSLPTFEQCEAARTFLSKEAERG